MTTRKPTPKPATVTAGIADRIPLYIGDERPKDLPTRQVKTLDLRPGDATAATVDGLTRLLVVEEAARTSTLSAFHPDGMAHTRITAALPNTTWTVVRADWARNRPDIGASDQYHVRLAPGRTACSRPLVVPQQFLTGNMDLDWVLRPVDVLDTNRWCHKCVISLAMTAGNAHNKN